MVWFLFGWGEMWFWLLWVMIFGGWDVVFGLVGGGGLFCGVVDLLLVDYF